MKTLIKSLTVALSLGVVTSAATFAETNPIGQPKSAATYQTGIYSSQDGKLNIALDKDQGGAVLVCLKDTNGESVYSQRIGKNEQKYRVKLNLNELPDGTYTLEISNGIETKYQAVTLATKKPLNPTRVIQTEAVATLK